MTAAAWTVALTGVCICIVVCIIGIVRCLFEDGNECPGLGLDLCLRLSGCLCG